MKKNKLFGKIIVLVSLVFVVATSNAQNKGTFSIEIDPFFYTVFKGAGAHFIWSPKNSKHLIYGFTMVYSLNKPAGFTEMNSRNKGQGWHYRINIGNGIFGEYYFKEPNRKWFLGLSLATQEIRLTNDNVPNESDRTNIGLVTLSTGYKLYPLKKINLYIKPWIAFGYVGIMNGSFSKAVTPATTIGSKEYYLVPYEMSGSINIGYTF